MEFEIVSFSMDDKLDTNLVEYVVDPESGKVSEETKTHTVWGWALCRILDGGGDTYQDGVYPMILDGFGAYLTVPELVYDRAVSRYGDQVHKEWVLEGRGT